MHRRGLDDEFQLIDSRRQISVLVLSTDECRWYASRVCFGLLLFIRFNRSESIIFHVSFDMFSEMHRFNLLDCRAVKKHFRLCPCIRQVSPEVYVSLLEDGRHSKRWVMFLRCRSYPQIWIFLILEESFAKELHKQVGVVESRWASATCDG